jgi:hypothetical protein
VIVTIRPGVPVDGVEVAALEERLLLAPGAAKDVAVAAAVDGELRRGLVTGGSLIVRVRGSTDVRLPWVLAVPDPAVDLLSKVAVRATGARVSDVTPAVVSFVAGAIVGRADPEVRPLDMLEVELERNGDVLGVLSRRREVLPGRYAFGLTGRGPSGERLPRGTYTIRLLARPGDGTRRQVETVEYVVR